MSIIDDYINEMYVNGKSKSYIETIKYNLNGVERWKSPLKEWTKEDVNAYILNLIKNNKAGTVELKKAIIKSFFEWAGKEEIIKHLHFKKIENTLRREDILAIDDINKLIEVAESPMYKALIAFLFETGARISEAIAVKVSDIQETDKGMVISVPQTKTSKQPRRCLCKFSGKFIRNLMIFRGIKIDRDKNKNERLFPITRNQAWKMLKIFGSAAEIEKPISPHMFRHAQATDMLLRGYQVPIIMKKLGWKPESNMIARYIHLVDDDVINVTAEMAGSNIPGQAVNNLKQPDDIKIADTDLQLSKLSVENEELKKEMESQRAGLESQKAQIDELLKFMGKMTLKQKMDAAVTVDELEGKIPV
jgi:integrase/recombinase XerD